MACLDATIPTMHAISQSICPVFRFILLGCLLLAGCASAPPEGTHIFDAWGPDGEGGEYEHPSDPKLAVRASTEYGIIYRFQPGDTINLGVVLDGDIIRSDTPIESVLRVQQPLWVHFGPNGIVVSFDGETWSDFRDAATGNISIDFDISEDNPQNRAFLRLRADQK